MSKHNWLRKEDKVCCLACYVYAMEGKGDDVHSIHEELCAALPHISPGSIRMKMQNIKQLFIEHKIEHTFNIAPLEKYSVQCEEEFLDALRGEVK